MKRIKRILILVLVLLLAAGILLGIYVSQNWPLRFRSRLDQFFGEGQWACISQETRESIIYSDYVIVRSNPALSGEVPGKFHNWDISFQNRQGQQEIWTISDHTLRINHDRYGLFSGKRYSAQQALGLELMEISFGMVGEEIHEQIICTLLSEEEAACIKAEISYSGGNPQPAFYDELWRQPWFTAADATAEDYLTCDLQDFYLSIRCFDYRMEKLTEEQQQNILNSLEPMAELLCRRFGEAASFTIYLDEEHRVEYIDGQKQ